MPNIFAALEIGKRALQTQQVAIQTSEHNVANANTLGYSRQSALIATAPSLSLTGLSSHQSPATLGTGTQVATISRARDQFLDARIREMTEDVGKFSRLQDVYDVIEIVLNELSETTDINHLFSEFWNAWETLAQDPTDRALRVDLVQRADTLIGDVRSLYARLRQIGDEQDSELHTKIGEVNQKAELIAQLNADIVIAESSGALANDLRDRRSLLVEELAGLSNIEVAELANGSLNVSIEGVPLVQGNNAYELHIALGQGANRVLTSNGTEARFSAGEIGGIVAARDLIIPGLCRNLDELAATLIEEVNLLHRQGYSLDGNTTNTNFFEPYNPVHELQVTQEEGQFSVALPDGERVALETGRKLTLIPANLDAQLSFTTPAGLTAGKATVRVLSGGLVNVVDDGGTGLTEANIKQGNSRLPTGEHQIEFELRGEQLFARLDQGRGVAVSEDATLVAGDAAKALQVLFERIPDGTGTVRFVVDRNAQVDPSQTQLLSVEGTGLRVGELQGFVSSVDVSGAAEKLAVSPSIARDIGLIAAAETTAPGDNENALRITQLQAESLMAGGTLTLDAFYGSVVTSLGIEVEETQQSLDTSDLVLQQMQNRRESISGVSLDEEMTNIIRFQNVYDAAARLVTIVDAMMDTVIHRMGVTR